MNIEIFKEESEKLLYKMLNEPGWFSFFPSSFFWKEESIDINNLYKKHFLEKKENNLYIHIPFCDKICLYCNCFKQKLSTTQEIDKYLQYLEKEIVLLYKLNNNSKIKIKNIFIWWWSPNILNLTQLWILFWHIRTYFELEKKWEFLIDCHPNFLNREKINLLYSNWINRITIAVQSLDKKVLLLNNRDFYNLKTLKENIFYIKFLWIRINIDVIIWLNWQKINDIKKDLEFLENQKVDNISNHYLMVSNNFKYEVWNEYQSLIKTVKNLFKTKKLPKNSQNILESDNTTTKKSTIWIWSSSVSNLYEKVIYQNESTLTKYYDKIEKNDLPFHRWLKLWLKEEMIKYIYLNIFSGIDTNNFFEIFWKNIFKEFYLEFDFLNKNNIIKLEDWVLKTNKNDFDTLIYFWIFFINKFHKIKETKDMYKYYFLDDWSLIDR